MALFCIILGSIRSLHFVKKMIERKKLLETSISMNSAKKFPITASCVLFGLYIFFKFVYFSRFNDEKFLVKFFFNLTFYMICH